MSQLQQGIRLRDLTGGNLDSSIPLYQRDEWWIRWPAKVPREIKHAVAPLSRHQREKQRATRLFSFLWEWATSDVFHLLLVCVPAALVAGSLGWKSDIIFSLGVLSLAGLEAVISSSLERLCLPFSEEGRGLYYADLISIVTPTAVSLRFYVLPLLFITSSSSHMMMVFNHMLTSV